MSSSKLAFLILVIACLVLIAWARPRSRSSIFNEVTSLPAERRMSNEIMDQISPMRRPHRRDYFVKKRPLISSRMMMSRSPFPGRFYSDAVQQIAPGGANYFGNDVLPFSTYEILEPESLY
ncbi:uncharacterized protein LOC6543290 [Drosophila erecta]|uniref:Uncharacterized protein n=1 Tax=Drosophila erecta TaxID=7220 RepID=B3N4M1_DROER|nr:uncharacterized protein LOC6543290 [Drosophila erecta]EDV58933.1 uncharacterized protein Dere_GG23700 [Drosophila erecta]